MIQERLFERPPRQEPEGFEVMTGDVMSVLAALEPDSFDALLCDPPYGIGFMGKEWDSPGAFVQRKAIRSNKWDQVGGNHNPTDPLDRSRTRVSENAKYQQWTQEWAEAALRVLKPGAFALVFGGTRTFHRLAVALEDAGFEVVDTLMYVYGSGFPKSHDVSKAIDKAAGAERKVVGSKLGQPGYSLKPNDTETHGRTAYGRFSDAEAETAITAPATPEAERWQGYGTALKPAYEPILLVRKPTRLTYARNALEHGTGALNIDGARIGYQNESDMASATPQGRVTSKVAGSTATEPDAGRDVARTEFQRPELKGRWPANLIHDGSEEVVGLFPANRPGMRTQRDLKTTESRYFGADKHPGVRQGRNDTGGAARFFYNTRSGEASADSDNEGAVGFKMKPGRRREAVEPSRLFYTAKASAGERNAGLDAFEPQVLGHNLSSNACAQCGLAVQSNGSGKKCECGPDRVTVKRPHTSRNPHPTVKPLALTRYLATLLLPPEREDGQPRRLLVPFAGSGSEVIGGMQAGWDACLGIEISDEYAEVARARIAHWAEQP